MTKKKIALVSNTSFYLYNFRFGLIRKLKEIGYEVITVSHEDDYTEYLKSESSFYPVRHLDRKGTNPFKDLKLLLEFLRLYKRLKIHLVINHTIKPNIYSSLACGFLKIPSVSVITGLGYVFVKGGLLRKLIEIMYRISFKFNKCVIVQNHEDLEVVSNLTDNSRIALIKGEGGINTDDFSPSVCQQEKFIQKTIFLFMGRFLKHKGIYELIEAGKRLWEERQDFEVWLLGSVDAGNPGSLREDDVESLKTLEFIKILPFAKDVRPILCKAHCLVLPSFYREGTPRTLLEAMAMEKPIITTNAPGCRDVCEDGVNGFLVKPKDVESLYLAMKRFMSLPLEDRKSMGKAGRRKVLEEFDEKIVIQKYLDLIHKIL